MSKTTTRAWIDRVLLLAGTVALPIAVMCVYLLGSRTPVRWFTPWSDYLAFGISIAAGAICLWQLLPKVSWRALALLFYFFICAGILFMVAFSFVCWLFRDCL